MCGLTAVVVLGGCDSFHLPEDDSIVDLEQEEGKTHFDRVKSKAGKLYAKAAKVADSADLREMDEVKARAEASEAGDKKIKASREYQKLIDLAHDILYPLPGD